MILYLFFLSELLLLMSKYLFTSNYNIKEKQKGKIYESVSHHLFLSCLPEVYNLSFANSVRSYYVFQICLIKFPSNICSMFQEMCLNRTKTKQRKTNKDDDKIIYKCIKAELGVITDWLLVFKVWKLKSYNFTIIIRFPNGISLLKYHEGYSNIAWTLSYTRRWNKCYVIN